MQMIGGLLGSMEGNPAEANAQQATQQPPQWWKQIAELNSQMPNLAGQNVAQAQNVNQSHGLDLSRLLQG